MKNILLISALLFSYPCISSGKMYKCTGENGKIKFSDNPCITGTQKVISGTSFSIAKNEGTLKFRPLKGVKHLPYDKYGLDKILKAQVKKGDPAAMYNLAVLALRLGELGKAMDWFYKSGLHYIKDNNRAGASDTILAIKSIDETSWFIEKIEEKLYSLNNN